MNTAVGLAAVAAVCAATVLIGIYGLRISRTTGDFYVASRTVKPWWNASAIGGEYISAASFLGVAGLILISGIDALWFPVGYTAGYLMLLLFVAAPLRRSGAYTIPDFAAARLDSTAARRVTSLLVVAVGWLYIVPQLHGAALTIRIATGLPGWAGAVVVVVVVVLSVVTGGMRSITFVQAFQYWLKLTALAVPVVFILLVLTGSGQSPTGGGAAFDPALDVSGDASLYRNISLIVALLFGTLGLPHVLVRFYTNPDGAAARRTTQLVLGLLALFYLFPTIYGVLGRLHTPRLAGGGQSDATVLLLPGRIVDGLAGDLLSALRGGRSLRRVPLHHVRAGGVAGRRGQPGPVPRQCQGFPAGRGVVRHRPAGHCDGHRIAGPGRQRRRGVCLHRLDNLPVAAAGHLVARAH